MDVLYHSTETAVMEKGLDTARSACRRRNPRGSHAPPTARASHFGGPCFDIYPGYGSNDIFGRSSLSSPSTNLCRNVGVKDSLVVLLEGSHATRRSGIPICGTSDPVNSRRVLQSNCNRSVRNSALRCGTSLDLYPACRYLHVSRASPLLSLSAI